jgi:hypothetical protein
VAIASLFISDICIRKISMIMEKINQSSFERVLLEGVSLPQQNIERVIGQDLVYK